MINFESPDPLDWLDAASTQQLDALPFGVIRMERDGVVLAYNAFESRLAGLSPERVLGRVFFSDVAPCINNYLVAERLLTEPELDVSLDYVFTLRMKPTAVRLRLLKSGRARCMYLLVRR